MDPDNPIIYNNNNGSGALSGKMLLLRIIEYNKSVAYFKSG